MYIALCLALFRTFYSLGAHKESLAVAHSTGAQFIRVEGYVFAHVADEGLIESCAGELLRYRRNIGAEDIMVWTDIKKKHRLSVSVMFVL